MNRALTHLRTRRFISTTSPFSYKIPPGRTGAEGRGGGARYRSISFLAIPFIVGLSVLFVVYKKEPKRTPFVQYEYLRRRAKRFPWGDGTKSLFHNPKYNALPTGYEYELEDEETLEECDETQPPPSGSNPPAAPTG